MNSFAGGIIVQKINIYQSIVVLIILCNSYLGWNQLCKQVSNNRSLMQSYLNAITNGVEQFLE